MARKTYSEEEIQKQIDLLPEEAADLLYSHEMASIIKNIADKHKLHIDQTGLLEAEAGELMLGLTEPQDFVGCLMETLQIDKTKADEIARDINSELMSKVRALMGQPSKATTPAAPEIKPMVPTPTINSAPEKSVALPLAAPTPAPAAPKPAQDLAAAEVILAHKQVSAPAAPISPAQPAALAANAKPAAPATANASASMKTPETAQKSAEIKPQPYKADPYREPIE